MINEFESHKSLIKRYEIKVSETDVRDDLVLKPVTHVETLKMLELLTEESRGKYNIRLDYPFQIDRDHFYQEFEFVEITFCHQLRVLWNDSWNAEKVNINSHLSFHSCKFPKGLDFANCKFSGNIRFHDCLIQGSVNFYNTSFTKLIDFYGSIFDCPTKFHLTDFDQKAIFSKCVFNDTLLFLHNKVTEESFLSFEAAQMKYDLDLSRSNLICPMQFWSVDLKLSFIHLLKKYSILNFYGNDDRDESEATSNHLLRYSTFKKLRETYRLIKKNLLDSKNGIEALNYISREHNAYFYELIFSFQGPPNPDDDSIKSRSMHIFQLVVIPFQWGSILLRLINLFFNKISSNHGKSWFQGILFTYFMAQLGFILHGNWFLEGFSWTINMYEADIRGTFTNSIRLLIPTDLTYEIGTLDGYPKDKPFLESQRVTFVFLLKVILGFGIYQTVQAFRNIGKNS